MRRTKSLTSKEPSSIFELTIDSLSYHGGRGVGRHDNIVVFVGNVVPGDVVRVRTTNKKSRLWEAELLEVIKPSPNRRVPPCPVVGRCGGCSWQQVDYPTQIAQKEKILRDSLRGLNKFGAWDWLPFDQAPDEFHYRNRIQVHFRGGKLGFFKHGTRDLVAIEKCYIADERLNAELKNLEAVDGAKIEIALTETGEVRIMGSERDPEAALFAQVNQAQNLILKKRMLELVKSSPDWIMDLYAGAGNLSLPLATLAKPVWAVELSKASILRARNLSENQANIEWLAADVAVALRKRAPQSGSGLIVLDPPRAGLENEVVEQVLRHRPRQIVYVSCNPTTFARDAEKFVASGQYRLESVRGLDMFPQTEHVELIASLCAATET